VDHELASVLGVTNVICIKYQSSELQIASATIKVLEEACVSAFRKARCYIKCAPFLCYFFIDRCRREFCGRYLRVSNFCSCHCIWCYRRIWIRAALVTGRGAIGRQGRWDNSGRDLCRCYLAIANFRGGHSVCCKVGFGWYLPVTTSGARWDGRNSSCKFRLRDGAVHNYSWGKLCQSAVPGPVTVRTIALTPLCCRCLSLSPSAISKDRCPSEITANPAST
jgi:hypothetical protein